MIAATALLALLSCAGRLPSALLPDAPALGTTAPAAGPASWEGLVGNDPLLRRPSTALAWPEQPEYEAVRAFAAIARLPQPQPADWRSLERSFPGSIAVPLARGALLADLEALIGAGIRPAEAPRIASLLLPLSELDRNGPSDVRAPLAWAARAGQEPTAADLLHFAERRVMLGWLDGPGLPVEAAAHAMRPGVHDRLIGSPAGAILTARAQDRRDDAAGARGREALAQATTLALLLVAAETGREQEQARERLLKAGALLPPQAPDRAHERDIAVRLLLERAQLELLADAGTEESSGLALVAATAERVRGQCPDSPCGGLDRSEALSRISLWGPAPAAQASLWQVILARQAVVGLELNLDRPTFHSRLQDTVEVLLGEGVESLPLSLLRQGGPGPSTWLAVTRATGAPDATEAEHGLRALRELLIRRCDRALNEALGPEDRELIERIRSRASAPPRTIQP